jgi:hypothetical protein
MAMEVDRSHSSDGAPVSSMQIDPNPESSDVIDEGRAFALASLPV